MTYLLSNIIIYLLLAGSIGAIAGWWFGRSATEKKQLKRYRTLLQSTDTTTSQLSVYRKKLAEQDITIRRLTSTYTLKERDNSTLAKALINFQKKYKQLKSDCAELEDELIALKKGHTELEQTRNDLLSLKHSNTLLDEQLQAERKLTEDLSKQLEELLNKQIQDNKIPQTNQQGKELTTAEDDQVQTTVSKSARINLLRPFVTKLLNKDKPPKHVDPVMTNSEQAPDSVTEATVQQKNTVEPDDLTLIKGIGKVNEKILHNAGITTFAQIARFTADDEKHYGEMLGSFRERISQEEWVKQARELYKQKYEQ